MMDKFEAGEVAIVFNQADEEIHLKECVVTVGLLYREWEGDGRLAGQQGAGHMYEIEINGEPYLVFPSELRKKKPKEEPATWQEIQQLTNWNPTEQKVTQ